MKPNILLFRKKIKKNKPQKVSHHEVSLPQKDLIFFSGELDVPPSPQL